MHQGKHLPIPVSKLELCRYIVAVISILNIALHIVSTATDDTGYIALYYTTTFFTILGGVVWSRAIYSDKKWHLYEIDGDDMIIRQNHPGSVIVSNEKVILTRNEIINIIMIRVMIILCGIIGLLILQFYMIVQEIRTPSPHLTNIVTTIDIFESCVILFCMMCFMIDYHCVKRKAIDLELLSSDNISAVI